jgi:hypothetical protein
MNKGPTITLYPTREEMEKLKLIKAQRGEKNFQVMFRKGGHNQYLEPSGGPPVPASDALSRRKERLYRFVDEIIKRGIEHWIATAEGTLQFCAQSARADPGPRRPTAMGKRHITG